MLLQRPEDARQIVDMFHATATVQDMALRDVDRLLCEGAGVDSTARREPQQPTVEVLTFVGLEGFVAWFEIEGYNSREKMEKLSREALVSMPDNGAGMSQSQASRLLQELHGRALDRPSGVEKLLKNLRGKVCQETLDKLEDYGLRLKEVQRKPFEDLNMLLQRPEDARHIVDMFHTTATADSTASTTANSSGPCTQAWSHLLDDFCRRAKCDPQEIGRGSTGKVFKVILEGGTHRAVKVIRTPIGNKSQKACDEAKALQKIKHPNVVWLFQIKFDLDDEHRVCELLLVMQYVPGGNLQQLIDKRAVAARERQVGSAEQSRSNRPEQTQAKIEAALFSSHEAAGVASQLVSALRYCVSEGQVHGDVKPHNVLVGAEAAAKDGVFNILLCDFSEVNLGTGTRRYMSPQRLAQYRSACCQRPVSMAKADVFSAGLTLLAMEAPGTADEGLNDNEQNLRRPLDGLRTFPKEAWLPEALRAMLRWREEPRPSFEQLTDFITRHIPLPPADVSDERHDEELASTPRCFGYKLDKQLVINLASGCSCAEQATTVHTFDVAGQEDYYILFQLFLSNQGISTVVYSLATVLKDPHSAERQLRLWLSALRLHAPHSRIIVVTTHTDVCADEPQLAKAKRSAEAMLDHVLSDMPDLRANIAGNIIDGSLIFYVDNSRRPAPGIEQLRTTIEAQCNDTVGCMQPVPLRWLRILDAMNVRSAGQADGQWYLTMEEFHQIGEERGVVDKDECRLCLRYLESMGSVILPAGEPALIVIDPQHLVIAVADLMACRRRDRSSNLMLRAAQVHGEWPEGGGQWL